MSKSLVKQYIIDEKGNPAAVILPIKEYKRILSLIETKESEALSQSDEFKKLVQKGLEDVKEGKVSLWKDVWDEL